jgi:ketosteroid isomerase-like protein
MKLRMPGLRISVLGLAAVCWPQTSADAQMPPIGQYLSGSEKEEAVAKALIRERVEDLAKAIHAKDIDSVMSLYANIVSFDIGAPLLYVGAERKRQAWEAAFAAYTGPITYEFHDLNVTTDGDLAFVHSVNHVKGTLASGQTTDLWLRWTACLRRFDGE